MRLNRPRAVAFLVVDRYCGAGLLSITRRPSRHGRSRICAPFPRNVYGQANFIGGPWTSGAIHRETFFIHGDSVRIGRAVNGHICSPISGPSRASAEPAKEAGRFPFRAVSLLGRRPGEHSLCRCGCRKMELQPAASSGPETFLSAVHAFLSIPAKILLPIDFSLRSQAAPGVGQERGALRRRGQ
jgi:hypothetical protein